jgi:4-diphosphocytidyl-2-C-methyl-D-erythritol kinase
VSLPTPDAVRVYAYAKLNLDLRVLGVRPDGFHELRTVFQSIALHDTLTAMRASGPFRLACDTPGVPLDSSNLVWRAADHLWRALGRPGPLRGARVALDKRIPIEAGLGGGSADAAAALRALARLWGVRLRTDELARVAAALGADVPFCLTGGTAVGTGRGDDIAPLDDMPRLGVVLLLPGFGVSSAEAYRWYDASPARSAAAPPGAWGGRVDGMVNDLEPAVARRWPEIGTMKAALRQAGAGGAAMTGSGSTVFGMFPDRAAAGAAAAALGVGPWRAVATELLDRRAFARRSRPAALPGSANLG